MDLVKILACERCRLHKIRIHGVPGEGRNHGLMLIGEAPGREENACGRPFVGRSGQLMREIIRGWGWRPEDLFITNIVKCKPPNNRDPFDDEVAACIGYLWEQIAEVRPTRIGILGRVAALSLGLIGKSTPMGGALGGGYQINGIPAVVMYHPAYVARGGKSVKEQYQIAFGQFLGELE